MEVSRLLVTTLPPETGSKFNGLDCLVALVRNIYAVRAAQTDLTKAMSEFRAYEQANPLFIFAWSSFDRLRDGTEQGRKRCVAEKRKVLDALAGTAPDRDTTFAALMNSKLMAETLFSHKVFRLRRAVWTFPTFTMALPRDDELIEWDCEKGPYLPLRKVISNLFTNVQHPDGTFSIRHANPPALLRVLYTPSGLHEWVHCIDFRMPVGAWVPTETGALEELPRHKSERYELVASVRMRKDGTDSIMSFNRLSGENTVVTDSPAGRQIFNHEDETDCKFLLLYARRELGSALIDGAIAMVNHPGPRREPSEIELRYLRGAERRRSQRPPQATSTSQLDQNPWHDLPAPGDGRENALPMPRSESDVHERPSDNDEEADDDTGSEGSEEDDTVSQRLDDSAVTWTGREEQRLASRSASRPASESLEGNSASPQPLQRDRPRGALVPGYHVVPGPHEPSPAAPGRKRKRTHRGRRAGRSKHHKKDQ